MLVRVLSGATLALVTAATLASAQSTITLGQVGKQPAEWFKSDEGQLALDHLVSWQNPNGGWWKAYDLSTTRPAQVVDQPGIEGDDDSVWHRTSTIDNGATVSELRILARALSVRSDPRVRSAFDRGLGFLLAMQYANGGFPQRFPIEPNYGSHITYNDDAMVGVLLLLRDVRDGKEAFALASTEQKDAAGKAFMKGIDCVLATQIVVDGKPTIWCQQHDAAMLAPASARAYELPSFATTESAAITNLMMDLPDPDSRVQSAIAGAVAWFEAHKIEGKKVEKLTGPQYPKGREVRVVDAPGSFTWARFYDLETGKPFMCDRDGVKVDSIEKLSHDRRVGYAWYGTRPAKVIERYAKWKIEHSE